MAGSFGKILSHPAARGVLLAVAGLHAAAITAFVVFGRVDAGIGSVRVRMDDLSQPALQLSVVMALLFVSYRPQGRKGIGRLAAICFACVGVCAAAAVVLVSLGAGRVVETFSPAITYDPRIISACAWGGGVYMLALGGIALTRPRWIDPAICQWSAPVFLVFFPCFIAYMSNGFSEFGGDVTWNGLIPPYIANGGWLPISQSFAESYGSWGLMPVGEKLMPVHPVGSSLFAMPTAVLQRLMDVDFNIITAGWNQKVTAAWVTALSAAFLFGAAYTATGSGLITAIVTLAFAFGSPQASISSVTLWQHGPTSMLICAGLLLLTLAEKGNRPRLAAAAAFPLAFLPLMRPTAIVFYFAGMAASAVFGRRAVIGFLAWSIPGGAAALAVHLGLYHNLLGGYEHFARHGDFSASLVEGMAGILFSANRGLFVFSPFFLLGVAGAYVAVKHRSITAICMTAAAVAYLLIHAKWSVWYAGATVGPRFAAETVPALAIMAAMFMAKYRRAAVTALAVTLAAISTLITAPGMIYPREQGQWNIFPDIDNEANWGRLWSFDEWLPLHFIHARDYQSFRQVPVCGFVFNGRLAAEESGGGKWRRVRLDLDGTSKGGIVFPQTHLADGMYTFQLDGEAKNAANASVTINAVIPGISAELETFPVAANGAFRVTRRIRPDAKRPVQVNVKADGTGGTILLDTARLSPAG
ncbi:MAG: hypothetical protein HZB29_14355 [Nitrospinae bacterium]|nr:hypothetical protein [Nitrospinota bacterium]